MNRNRTPIAATIIALALSGCVAAPYGDVRIDKATEAQVIRQPYYLYKDLVYACAITPGATFTVDRRACLLQRPGRCYYLTLLNDAAHNAELTARCNGWHQGLRNY